MKNIFKIKKPQVLTEALPPFKKKGGSSVSPKSRENTGGEGYDQIGYVGGYGKQSVASFNSFYKDYINTSFEGEVSRISNYRLMAEMPEIASVLEDIIIESTQEDIDGDVITLKILDTEIQKNENIVTNITDEFNSLFTNKIKLNDMIWDFFRSYYTDGRLYLEKVINKGRPSLGIINLKRLPSETMGFELDPISGKIIAYYQYLKQNPKKPTSMEEAEQDEDIVVFYPEQIIFLDYGIYGRSKEEIFGYLEKVKQPFNQLKLLETSLIIYRIVKSPERLVFSIDTGSMPMEKSMKFVEKIKAKLTQKVSYDSKSGGMHNQPEIMSMLDNYFLPQCLRLDTKISCLDGNDKTLSQMIDDFSKGIPNEVLSVDQKTGNIIKGVVEWAGITRKDAELVRVHLDNGDSVDVTPDHKFVMRDGSEVEAQYLNTNDSLMPYYTRDKKICSSSNEYKQVFNLSNNKWEFVHRIVKPVDRGNVVHHEDFDRYNNMSSNLQEMGFKDHFDYHSSVAGDRLKEMWKDDDFREMMTSTAKKTAIKRWSNSDERERQSVKMSAYWKDNYELFHDNISKPKSPEHKQSLSDSIKNKWLDDDYRQRVSKSSKDRWDDPEFRCHMSSVQKCVVDEKCKSRFIELYITNDKPSMESFMGVLSDDKIFMDNWSDINQDKKNTKKTHLGKISFYCIIKDIGFDNYGEFKKGITINHKVSFVELLDIREDTGCLTIKDPGNNHNFPLSIGVFVKNSADGRGSSISSVGGNPSGFAEIDDIWYFARKLYIALKYPMSRVTNMQEGRSGDTQFMGSTTGEINRDEIRWAKFLERHQNKFTQAFTKLLLLHLEFMGLKKEYDLDESKLHVMMTPPNNYKQQMSQQLLESQMNNYQNVANNPEISKSYAQERYLGWSEEDIQANSDGFKKDKKLFPQQEF